MIVSRPNCEGFVSWLSGSGEALENPARWAGILIAILGALVVNPEATAHGISTVQSYVLDRARRVRARLARYLPFLRRDVSIHVDDAVLNLSGGGVSAFRGGLGPLARDATIEEKIQALDERTIRLHDEVEALRVRLDKSEGELRDEIAASASELRREIAQTQGDLKDLQRSAVQSDAKALPIIVLGVVLSGLSQDADSLPMWFALLVLLGAVAASVVMSWRIFADWRAGRNG